MRVLLLGATGFIGSQVLAALAKRGTIVRALARGRMGLETPGVEWRKGDLQRLTSAEAWDTLLEGCDAVVNCAGVFADSRDNSIQAVHQDGPAALYEACARRGVRRVVLVSAIGADDELTPFARTKLAGEQALQRHDLDWVILRPSIVVGSAAYGGGALLRGLASLPVLPLESGLGAIQPVLLSDVVDTITAMIEPDAPRRVTLTLAGPDKMDMAEAVAGFRRWLRWKPARRFATPSWLAGPLYLAGDFANWLGWRTPVSSAGRKELKRGAEGDVAPWAEAIGRQPESLQAWFQTHPASIQERRFAALYFLKPLIFAITALFWIGTSITSIGPGYEIGVRLLEAGGMGALSGPSVIAGGIADMLVGVGIAFRRTTRLALWVAIAISLFYFVAGTALLPVLWLDPIGPMLKIWPLIVLNLVALAMVDDR